MQLSAADTTWTLTGHPDDLAPYSAAESVDGRPCLVLRPASSRYYEAASAPWPVTPGRARAMRPIPRRRRGRCMSGCRPWPGPASLSPVGGEAWRGGVPLDVRPVPSSSSRRRGFHTALLVGVAMHGAGMPYPRAVGGAPGRGARELISSGPYAGVR